MQPLSTLSSSNMVDYFLSLNVASSKNLADRARNFFHKHGISTWMCTDIEGGDTYRDQILGNVRDAKVFLIFLNEKWAQSQECTFEYNYAMRKRLVKEKPVIMPLVTESFDLEKYAHVDALMANCQGLFFSNCATEEDAFKKIVESLQNVVPYQAEAPAPKPAPKVARLSENESKELEIVTRSLDANGPQTLPSGKWQGFFVDHRVLRGHSAGSKWLIDVNITFFDLNTFTGTGIDDIGPFTFTNGFVNGTSVQFVKDYGTHRVLYEGQVMGVQMLGRWKLEPNPDISGEWAMWPIS